MVVSNSLPEQYTIRAGEQGRLVLPVKLRKQIGLEDGDHIMVTIESDNSVRLVNLRHQVERCQGIFKDVFPDGSLAEELIQDRRAEAQREIQE